MGFLLTDVMDVIPACPVRQSDSLFQRYMTEAMEVGRAFGGHMADALILEKVAAIPSVSVSLTKSLCEKLAEGDDNTISVALQIIGVGGLSSRAITNATEEYQAAQNDDEKRAAKEKLTTALAIGDAETNLAAIAAETTAGARLSSLAIEADEE